jgi:hypothetical protein
MIQEEEFSMILTSDATQGASNVSTDGSSYEVQLNEALTIPKNCLSCSVALEEASIWWNTHNINSTNNKLYLTGQNVAGTTTAFTITIPNGLYDLPSLNLKIQQLLENDDGKISPYNNFDFIADNASSKVIIKFNYTDCEIDFTQSDTPRTILGFNSAVYGTFAGAPYNLQAPNVASFNTIDNFQLHTDLVDAGLLINNKYSQVVAQVLIDVEAGSQIIYQPLNPTKIEANNLIGGSRRMIRVWLTDNTGAVVDTNGELFTMKLKISYKIPVFINN